MIILIGNFLLCVLLAAIICILPIATNKKNTIFAIVSFMQLLIVHGLAVPDTTPDLSQYEEMFSILAKQDIGGLLNGGYNRSGENIEMGFLLYITSISWFSESFTVFLIINSIVFLGLFYRAFLKYSPYICISILLLVLIPYNQSLYILRQYLSLAILLLSYPYIINRDLKKFLLVFFISLLFHKSSLVFFPVYFVYGLPKRYFFLTIIVIVASFKLISPILMSYAAAFSERYSGFAEYDTFNIATKGLIMGMVLLVYLFVLRKHAFENGINKLVLTISIIGTIGNFFIGEAGVGRIFLSYYVVMTLQIPIIMKYMKGLLFKSVFVTGTFVLFFLFAYIYASDVKYLIGYSLVFV